MIAIRLNRSLVNKAEKLYNFKCVNSFTDMKSAIYGAIGELVVSTYYREPLEGKKDYDIILFGHTFDIKTKRCNSVPRPHYNVSVPVSSLHQQCSYYMFTRVHEDKTTAWILGYASKEQLLEGEFLRKGQSDGAGFEVSADCYNLKISQLWTTGY